MSSTAEIAGNNFGRGPAMPPGEQKLVITALTDIAFSMRWRMHSLAGIAVIFLSIYGRAVCPFVAGVELNRLVMGLMTIAIIQILLRELLFKLFPQALGNSCLARHGMYMAVVSWLLSGIAALALHMQLYPSFPMGSHVKLLTGYWALGGGILSQLEYVLLERYLRENGALQSSGGEIVERITRRLMEGYAIFTVVPALILILVMLRNVFEGYASMDEAIEVMFVGAVFVAAALYVSRQYGLALHADCAEIRAAVAAVGQGRFDTDLESSRPDEIGLVARSIGSMGKGLAIRERRESKLLQITSAFSEQLHLETLLRVITTGATELLGAERSTLYLYDDSSQRLWTPVAEGLDGECLYLESHSGIAGATFTDQQSIILEDVRKDARFNDETDKRTGFTTRSMICVPVNSKQGSHLGVLQVINRIEGEFGAQDEKRLRALAAQASTAIENAQLFEEVLRLKNYSDSILKSLSNGVISLDSKLQLTTMNSAAQRILNRDEPSCIGQFAHDLFNHDNQWITDSANTVMQTGEADLSFDTELANDSQQKTSVNLTTVPLIDKQDTPIGLLLIIEDLSAEKRIRNTMSRYMPKTVVDQVLSGHRDVIDGRMQEMTLLFTDIRSFTTLSESIGPRPTVTMLNDYFAHMMDVLDHHGGILDKYIGDAIMALFGVPLEGEHDERNAVATANDMMRALESLNRQRQKNNLVAIHHGIGVSTGQAIAGNIGSPRRMDYTVIGDSVNLAARIESITKFYSTPILVSDMTVKKLDDLSHLREIDRILVKGKTEPVTLFESFEYRATRLNDDSRLSYQVENEALTAYRQQQWQQASELFKRAKTLAPGNRIPEIYLTRIAHYLKNDPGADWDGIWTMSSK